MKNILLLFSIVSLLSCRPPAFTPWEQNVEKEKLSLKSLAKLSFHGMPFKVALVSDPQGRPEDLALAVKEINKKGVDFILLAGDVTDYSLKHEYLQAMEALSNTNLPVLTVSGNHDGLAFGKSIFQDLFGPLDYDFNYGPFKFVMWNNNQFEYGTTNFESFRDRLTDRSIVVSHIPPSADAHTEEQYQRWKDIYAEKKPLLSLHGHLHHEGYYVMSETQVFVANRILDINYHLLTFSSSGLTIEHCRETKCYVFKTMEWPNEIN